MYLETMVNVAILKKLWVGNL